jgi:Fe-S cluster assembly protein SufD
VKIRIAENSSVNTPSATPLTQRLLEEYAGFARTLGPADAAAARRRTAIAAIAQTGLPSTREENWRYANLRPLERQRFIPPGDATAPVPPTLPASFPEFARYVFVDGLLSAGASAALDASDARLTLHDEEAGKIATSVAAGDGEAAHSRRFALLNDAFATGGLTIRVPAGTAPVRLELLFLASAEAAAGASYPRLKICLDPGASLVLIERHLSAAGAASFVASAVNVELGRGAILEHYRLQELNGRCILFDTLSAQLAQEAQYRLHAIGSGGRSSRSTVVVRLAGERAQLTLAVAALGEGTQVQDTFARVEHAAPRTRTVETFRGIAADRSRVAFNGKVVVGNGAAGTDSQQSLRGLLAGPEAEIDVRPQLEIYTDDVRCSHGATAGKLDDTMLFYLLSRGLSQETARRLLKWAFLEDVVAQIALPALRRQIEERLATGLRDNALRELL